jgi:hypothetical protein
MQQKPRTFSEIIVTLVTFQFVPEHDDGLVQMVRRDLSQLKGVAKQRRALSECNAYRASRSDDVIRIDFLDTTRNDRESIRFRMTYRLIAPFR